MMKKFKKFDFVLVNNSEFVDADFVIINGARGIFLGELCRKVKQLRKGEIQIYFCRFVIQRTMIKIKIRIRTHFHETQKRKKIVIKQ